MKKLTVDYREIQKAMEDISRDAFDYFLDVETGKVIILSEDIISRARSLLSENYDEDMADFEEVIFDEEYEMPEWMEDEIELALDIFINEKDRYVRIPEKNARDGFSVMKEFTENLNDLRLKKKLQCILDGKGAFRRFKDALKPYPKLSRLWYGFNADANTAIITQWLRSLGIEALKDQKRLN